MMGGIEFRWHKTFSTSQPRLEYRIKQDHGSYAGMFNPPNGTQTWSNWIEVPTVIDQNSEVEFPPLDLL